MVASAFSLGLSPSGYLNLENGYTAEYFDVGSGEPLVLVPGLAGGVALLEPLIEALSQSHRVVTFQLRGEGRGIFQPQFPFRQLSDDLDAVITELRLERPGLVGVSFGGAVALDYATRRAGRLRFLAVQGVGQRYRPGFFGAVAKSVLDRLPLPDDNPFVNQFFSVLIGGPRRPGDWFDFIVDRCWRTDQSVMAHRFALLDDYDIADRLSAVRTPTLVMNAEQDVFVSAGESRELARKVPDGRFCAIPGSGHLAFVTHPRQVTEKVDRFAASLGA